MSFGCYGKQEVKGQCRAGTQDKTISYKSQVFVCRSVTTMTWHFLDIKHNNMDIIKNFSYPLKKNVNIRLHTVTPQTCISCISYVMLIYEPSRLSFYKFGIDTSNYYPSNYTPFQSFLTTKSLFSGFSGLFFWQHNCDWSISLIPGWGDDKDIFTLTSAVVPRIKRASCD